MMKINRDKIEMYGNIVRFLSSDRGWYASNAGNSAGRIGKVDCSEEDKALNRQRTLKRAMRRYERLVGINFQKDFAFLTLTFANDFYSSRERANPEFHRFITLLRATHCKDLKYIASIEMQKRGVIHYHLLIRMPYLPLAEIQKKWGRGICHIKKIPPDCPEIAVYTGKYVAKDMESFSDDLKDKKIFLRSQNLDTRVETLSSGGVLGQFMPEIIAYLSKHLKILSNDTWTGHSEHIGNYSSSKIILSPTDEWRTVGEGLMGELAPAVVSEEGIFDARQSRIKEIPLDFL